MAEPFAEAVASVRRDGFVHFPGLFPAELAARAHDEILAWYQRDREERVRLGVSEPRHEGVAGVTILTRPTHLMLDVYGRSPALDSMFETLLGDPGFGHVLRNVAGERIKLRGFNVRLMTGEWDPPPAHEWHRDSPGEIGLGILLTDVEPGVAGATALVPGSHEFPYDPRQKTLFPGPYAGLRQLAHFNPFARLLARSVLGPATGAAGSRGDAYFFVNDTWHGRQPNLRGACSMVVLIGAFPTEFPYPDEVPLPTAEVRAALPPRVAEALRQDQLPNADRTSYLHQLLAERARRPEPLLFRLARYERAFADVVSSAVVRARGAARAVLGAVARRLRGAVVESPR